MKYFSYLAVLTVLLFASCSKIGTKGELVGVKGQKWIAKKPYGMELIPSGAFVMGKTNKDVSNVGMEAVKTVTVQSFYMDDTEITNSEYRQFVHWVRDSIVRTKLAILSDELGLTTEDGGIGNYAFKDIKTEEEMTPYEKYRFYNALPDEDNPYSLYRLNTDIDLIWNTEDFPDEYYAEVMDEVFVDAADSYNGRRAIKINELKYGFTTFDAVEASKSPGADRNEFIKKEVVKVYPDTTVWIKDFSYSYIEPMHNDYFWHDAYSEYPVVGVSWDQARAFCSWRTKIKNDQLKSKGEQTVSTYRLPTEAEWEYAARGGIDGAMYPWGGPYMIADNGCFMANFKPARGDYAADSALFTVEARSFTPNDYNLYNMSGNVSEWTSSSYAYNAYDYASTLNPTVAAENSDYKVIRGGSWKDIAYFLRVNTRDFEHKDSVHSYVGFRTVQDYMGDPTTVKKK